MDAIALQFNQGIQDLKRKIDRGTGLQKVRAIFDMVSEDTQTLLHKYCSKLGSDINGDIIDRVILTGGSKLASPNDSEYKKALEKLPKPVKDFIHSLNKVIHSIAMSERKMEILSKKLMGRAEKLYTSLGLKNFKKSISEPEEVKVKELNNLSLAQLLKREKGSLSTDEFAKKIGIASKIMQKLLNGEHTRPSFGICGKIAEKLGFNTDYILDIIANSPANL